MIDKDIEILKEVQEIFEHLKNHGWIKDITKEVDIDKVIPAIENVLSEFQGLREFSTETVRRNAELQVELETYKKIAEWIIRYSINKSITTLDLKVCKYSRENKHCPNFSEENCIKCLLEYARKEVANGNNN